LEACGHNVFIQDLLEQVMYGHFVLLAAFFMESQPPTGAIMIDVMFYSGEQPRENTAASRRRNWGRWTAARRELRSTPTQQLENFSRPQA
jgi:hypothetical protein